MVNQGRWKWKDQNKVLPHLAGGTRIWGLFSSIVSSLTKFHHVRNLIVMNLRVMMDKVNGEIFPPMGHGRAPVFVAEGRKIQNSGGNSSCMSSLQAARGRRAPAHGVVF